MSTGRWRFSTAGSGGELEALVASTGETTTLQKSRDPRFGWIAPLDSVGSTRLPASNTLRTIKRSAAVSGATFQESVAINGRRYLSVYDTLARTLVERTPALRSRTMHFDAAGRLLDASFGGVITPVTFQYFPENSPYKGRLSHVAQGTRAWDYTQDAKGRLFTVTDPAFGTTSFSYDLADRVQTITLLGNHIVGYGYNASGALQTRTPLGRPAHGYGYSDLDDLSAYTPNGSAARSGKLRLTASPDSVMYGYGYDGPLLKLETWTGRVLGSVEWTPDADFRERTETVTVGGASSTVTNTYADLDGLLTQVTPTGLAPLDLHRRAADGLIDSTHAGPAGGGIHESRDYNAFGELANLRYRIGTTTLLQQSLSRDALVASAGYDAQDRLQSHGDAAYDWSAAGELRERGWLNFDASVPVQEIGRPSLP